LQAEGDVNCWLVWTVLNQAQKKGRALSLAGNDLGDLHRFGIDSDYRGKASGVVVVSFGAVPKSQSS